MDVDETLLARCQSALDQLRDASQNSEFRSTDGRNGAISGKSALSAVGIRGDEAQEVRYYLRQLGLAKAAEESEHASNLWYWDISYDGGVEADALQKLTEEKPWKGRSKRRGEIDPNVEKIAELTAKLAVAEAELARYKQRYGELD